MWDLVLYTGFGVEEKYCTYLLIVLLNKKIMSEYWYFYEKGFWGQEASPKFCPSTMAVL